jgi:hypothetical protein
MTRTQALDAIRTYVLWKYDTDILLWAQFSQEEYVDTAMAGFNNLKDEVILKLGADAAEKMQNPVGMLVNKLRSEL